MYLPRAFFTLAMLLCFFCGCKIYFTTFSISASRSDASLAEELRAEGKHAQAIERYRTHIEKRLASKDRPEQENPYFYYLLIGDCYLELGDANKAGEAYETALNNNVSKESVNERFRRLGRWYEERERFEEAIAIFKHYRQRDPLLFDIEIDRVHKKIVQKDQQAGR